MWQLATRRRGPFEIDPESAVYRTERAIPSFLDLGVNPAISARLGALGITDPLPIQVATIADALAGRDVLAEAPTGSGKTLAFAIPLAMSASNASPGRPLGLVLVPTRELAEQVSAAISSVLGARTSRVVALYGGTGYDAQRRALRRGVDVVVACPGRLEDLLSRGDLRLDAVRIVVLDEADRMVDMGFVKPVCRVIDQTASGRQLLLFSATLGGEVSALSRRYQHQPARHTIAPAIASEANVTHLFWRTSRADRVEITAKLVAHHGQAFVFCRTKHGADRVARQLRAAGVEAVPIHGDRSQPQRARALDAFAKRRTHALVATDVVARGIHVEDVPCVVHFDPAGDADTYVHRSGRTGRLGSSGIVVSLVSDEVHADVRALQRALGIPPALTPPFAEQSRHPSVAGARSQAPAAPAPAPDRAQRPSAGRLTGKVKTFDRRRGYGFIVGATGTEFFVHRSHVTDAGTAEGYLHKGAPVSFDTAAGRRGPQARNVVALSGASR